MQHTPVHSSNLRSVGYDPARSVLEVAFHNGGIYQYLAVPTSEYRALMAASSHGSYLAQHIKGRYRYVKVA